MDQGGKSHLTQEIATYNILVCLALFEHRVSPNPLANHHFPYENGHNWRAVHSSMFRQAQISELAH